ncbi:glycoside hydrolase family 3 domain protein [Morchella conica CCBAS932]|uniref:beta-glucosidase n=1 Tax=Morchella conica CCBAS932 TaxID=1392247 RepID=A0A3N4KFT0_9PEZI|nr:glycoside hydrolase family 3 domain protein [Morchella conica CCBAS932]
MAIDTQVLLSQLTLEEKISLLAGGSTWRTAPIPRLGIPSIKVTDGPSGARGETFVSGAKSSFIPCSTLLAATFDRAAVEMVGQLLGDETVAKGCQVLLAPTVCLQRSPLGGRNFEAFSEDPWLTGILGGAYVRGLQSKGVSATLKHYACNEQETRRFNVDVQISEKALRETYLLPFQMIVEAESPRAFMSSYNKVNGVHCDMNEFLLKKVLREEWGYKGIVMSDFGGTNSVVESLRAGLDLEMPGPPTRRRGLLPAIEGGEIAESELDIPVLRILEMIKSSGRFENPEERPEEGADSPEARSLLRRVAAEGTVLLKNRERALPLDPVRLNKIAVIGRLAKNPTAGGGGSATLNPHHLSNPFDAISDVVKDFGAEVHYAEGPTLHKFLPMITDGTLLAEDGVTPGVTIRYWIEEHQDFSGKPLETGTIPGTFVMMFGQEPAVIRGTQFAFRVTGTLTPKTTGNHELSLCNIGGSRLYINDQLVLDNWEWKERSEAFFTFGSKEKRTSVQLEAGVSYQLRVDSVAFPPQRNDEHNTCFDNQAGTRIGYLEEIKVDKIKEAQEIARGCDVAVLVVGMTDEWESEGHDRETLALPGGQDAMIKAVAAVTKTIVVNQSGAPISMPWLDDVDAVIQAWYQGQENGFAIADVLFGVVNPCGKLPITFPRLLEDAPCHKNFPFSGEDVVRYEEGTKVGYKHYSSDLVKPLFEFGFGLSYTSFKIEMVSGETLRHTTRTPARISCKVKNTGSVRGKEVVQVYIVPPGRFLRPMARQLAGFAKIDLAPGEAKIVSFELDKYSLGSFDEARGKWVAKKGARYTVGVGASSLNVPGIVDLILDESMEWL